MLTLALGGNQSDTDPSKYAVKDDVAVWMKKYAADNLRFIEFERMALPCALLRRNKGGEPSLYSFSAADADARVVMEQRLQSLVCCFSMIGRVFKHQSSAGRSLLPVTLVNVTDAVRQIYDMLTTIPELVERYLLYPLAYDIVNGLDKRNLPDEKTGSFKGSTKVTKANNINKEKKLDELWMKDQWKSHFIHVLLACKKKLSHHKSTEILDESAISNSISESKMNTSEQNFHRIVKFLTDFRRILEEARSEEDTLSVSHTDGM
jgi:hypothetical protein